MKDFNTMSDLVADAEDLLAKLKDAGGPEVQALKAKLDGSIKELRATASKQAKQALDQTQETLSAVVAFVEENPWVGVAAVSALAGCLIYMLMARRSDR